MPLIASNLQHSQAAIVAAALALVGGGVATQQGVVVSLTTPWQIFVNLEPDDPEEAITVYNTEGVMDGRTMDGEFLQHWGFQVKVRGPDNPTVFLKAQSLALLMDQAIGGDQNTQVTLGGYVYKLWNICRKPMIDLGKNVPGTKRNIYTINGTVAIQRLQIPTHFTVQMPGPVTQDVEFLLTVTALDASNAVDYAYAGTVHFSSSDSGAGLPSNGTLAGGSGIFECLLFTLGTQTVTATDTVTPSITGSGSATVN